MTTIRRRKLFSLGTRCDLTELRSIPGFALGTQVGLTAKKNELSLRERIAKTGVDSVRSHGQAFRDFPTTGRETV